MSAPFLFSPARSDGTSAKDLTSPRKESTSYSPSVLWTGQHTRGYSDALDPDLCCERGELRRYDPVGRS